MDEKEQKKDEQPPQSVESEVKRWQKKIRAAKLKFEPDMTRMKEDMEFVHGIQWPRQESLNDDRYVANIVLREVNQKVASLYARNPQAEATSRDRMDFAVWDEKPETLIQAATGLMQGMPDPLAMAIVQDYMQGVQHRQLLKRVAKTLTLEYQIQVDRQEPDFKLQMKQLVRRVVCCGVGYVRISFSREGRVSINPNQTAVPLSVRATRLAQLSKDLEDGKFDSDDAKFQQIQTLSQSLSYGMQDPTQQRNENEKLIFEFPSATSIIVDPCCTILKGFVGAEWIAVEYIKHIDEIKATFNKDDISVGSGDSDARAYSVDGVATPPNVPSPTGQTDEGKHVAVWEVFNKLTRERFFLCDGYKDYLLAPEEPQPCIQRFWPIISLTFNDTETVPGLKSSIYPPSDVRLQRSTQIEWNRSRQRMTEHRTSNKPKYLTGAGWLADEDKEALREGYKPGTVIELRGLPAGSDVGKMLAPFQHSPLDPSLYTTDPLEKDLLLTTGSQQANLGPITNRGTATEATISEQSRISSVGSNVDDLDDCLTEMARTGGEMMLREMSIQTVQRDCGKGAVWPMADRDEYVERIHLQVAAASSGRPNKGLEIANFERLAPLLMQAGVNPAFLVKEGVKRLDDRLDVNEAFPLIPTGPVAPQQGGPPEGQQAPAASNETSMGPPQPLPVPTDATTQNPS